MDRRSDPTGDANPDMVGLRLADDGTNLYILYEFISFSSGQEAFLLFDTDLNPATGCAAVGIGVEYGLTFVS
ncbi:MAG: hypothetical protein ACE5JX_07645, partial [Acidobacteriota bacterium]